jgi:hypothetical protein
MSETPMNMAPDPLRGPSTVLPDDVAFEGDGHASEIALAALADGEVSILGPAVAAHVDGCDSCTARLGEAALVSASVGDALRLRAAEITYAADIVRVPARPRPLPPRRERQLPLLAMAAALIVALVASGPSFVDPTGAPRWYAWVKVPLSVAGRLARLVWRGAWHPSSTTATLQWVASAVFLVVAIVIAARATKAPIQGEAS